MRTQMHACIHTHTQKTFVFIDIKYSGHDLHASTKAYLFNGVNITEQGVFKLEIKTIFLLLLLSEIEIIYEYINGLKS